MQRDTSLRHEGFTLVELLIVIGIIGLLLSLLLPALGSARARARSVYCAARLSDVGKAMAVYSINHGYLLPPRGSHFMEPRWPGVVLGDDYQYDENGVPFSDLLVCPSDPLQGNAVETSTLRNSYLVNTHVIWGLDRAHRLGIHPFWLSPSDAVVLGERYPDIFGLYLDESWSPYRPVNSTWDQVDLFRHGPNHRSNHLFLDLHVSNEALRQHKDPALHPWIPHVDP